MIDPQTRALLGALKTALVEDEGARDKARLVERDRRLVTAVVRRMQHEHKVPWLDVLHPTEQAAALRFSADELKAMGVRLR